MLSLRPVRHSGPRLSGAPAQGFSLVELVVAVAMFGVLISVALPSFSEWMNNLRVRAAVESIQAGLQRARAEAVRLNTPMTFWLVSDSGKVPGASCVRSSTSAMWVVSALNPTGACNAQPSGNASPPVVARSAALENAGALTVSTLDANKGTSANSVTFTSLGQTAVGASNFVSVDVVSTTGKSRLLRVMVDPGGMIRACDPAVTSSDPRSCT